MPDEVAADHHTTAVRAYGVLATSLNDTVAEARQALAPHTEVLADGTLAYLDALLAEFARRRVCIAIYGEVKAGKSTLLNAIAGAPLSPVAFEPLTSVPVRVTYGNRTAWRVGERAFESEADLAHAMRAGLNAPEVVVETNLDLLQLGGQVDLLDTPGMGSDARFDAISAEALRSLDAVVLVVRYPALFTQFTRRLMDGLQADIGKLFVVWNLDADCAELSPEERARHANTLRTKVVGAHELFMVDARAGLRAVEARDAVGEAASGLTAFAAALRRFATSDRREVAALRETAKRVHQWLAEAQRSLTERQAALSAHLSDTRARLQAVENAAQTESAAARTRHGECEAAMRRIGEERAASAERLAAELRQQLRAARRRWIVSANTLALEEAVAGATAAYADGIEAACRTANQAVHDAAARVETSLATMPRARVTPVVEPLAPEDRLQRAAFGRARLLRRALWRRWYLPGLNTLDRVAVASDLAAQAAWFEDIASTALQAAKTTLDHRLAAIAERAAAELERIKVETNFAAASAEFGALTQHLPIVSSQLARVTQITSEARALMG